MGRRKKRGAHLPAGAIAEAGGTEHGAQGSERRAQGTGLRAHLPAGATAEAGGKKVLFIQISIASNMTLALMPGFFSTFEKNLFMSSRLLASFMFLFFFFTIARGQYYDTGEDPASLRWKQIRTGRFRVIFPESYTREAIHFTGELEAAADKLGRLFTVKKINIPVIIHNYTTFSNGYVAWAPRRMELYPTPEQGSIPLDNSRQLALHELGHVMQMYALQTGFTKTLSVVFGEHVAGAAAALLPLWYMEGDAVFSETVLSNSGRGRVPSFQKQLKAIAAERGSMYNYDKMLNGSYRDFTPDHYRFGYQVVAWSKYKYGMPTWNKAMSYSGNYPFTIIPVNISLHSSTGMMKGGLFRETFDSLAVIWKNEETKSPGYSVISRQDNKEYTNYHSPVAVGRDSIVSIKTSLSSPACFVMTDLKTGREKKIHVPGNMYPWVLTGGGGKLAWVETRPDPRWVNRDYSVIMMMDIKSGTVRQLTHFSRMMSAAISPDGSYIAASESTVGGDNFIVIIDAWNGQQLARSAVPGNWYPQRPVWTDDSREVVLITLSEGGEGIVKFNREKSEWTTLKEPSAEDLQQAFVRNDSLFYIGSASGTDNIWLQTPGGKHFLLTSSRFGTTDFCFIGNRLICTDYTLNGDRLVIADITKPAEADDVHSSFFLAGKFNIAESPETRGEKEYAVEPYRKILHPLAVHSWMPVYADLDAIQSDPSSLRPGVTIMSQNNLSTLITTVGYEYSANREHIFHTKLTWKGWYPVIETSIDNGGSPYVTKPSQSDPDPSVIKPSFRFRTHAYIPLEFSTGRFSQYFQPSFTWDYLNRYLYNRSTSVYDYGRTELTTRLFFSNYHKSAYRDLNPRWAQILDYNFTWYPFDKEYYGNLSTMRTVLYFPGLLRNHSLRFRFDYEKQKTARYRLLFNRASFPRSYKNIYSEEVRSVSADYQMPLFYPDLALPGVIYIKRIRGGIFADYARVRNTLIYTSSGTEDHRYSEDLHSYGFELLSDFHLLRVPFMLTGGVQAAWRDMHSSPFLEMVFRVDIYGMRIGSKRPSRSDL
ncbi:MAG: hypothetical protein U0X39_15460 [Bacteroidales bacterium]